MPTYGSSMYTVFLPIFGISQMINLGLIGKKKNNSTLVNNMHF